VEGVAAGLQPALATARYVLSSTKLELEKPHLLELDSEARPLDLSFQPEPDIDGKAPPTPYTIIGGDITITPPVEVEASTLTNSDIVGLKETLTAAAEHNLQLKEKKKLMRPKVTDALGHETHGDILLGDLVKKMIMLIPMAIDMFGPAMLENFLFGYTPRIHPQPILCGGDVC